MEPRDQTECLGSGALCMTSGSSPVWAAGRDRGLTDRQEADAVPPAFIHWSSGSPQTLVESTGRKRGPAGLPSTLHRARTHWATSQPCLRGLLWPQGRRHQGPGLVTQDPVRGVWCPRPGELVQAGRGWAGQCGGLFPPQCVQAREAAVADPRWLWVERPTSCLLATSGTNLAQSHRTR